tara:strand:- start:47 stop:319 length:273 start_codon:yes stop_codon:yes gene_type:complete
MTQYEQRVNEQRVKLEAEEWANGVRSIHAHSTDSMWYDDRPQDTEDGKTVVDRIFNNGIIERTLNNGQIFLFTKEQLKGESLVDAYVRNN